MKRRFLSALVALCMTLTLLPASAMAESPEAQWGVAAADGTKPAEWAGSGTLEAAVTYANELSGGTAYIQLLSDVTAATTVTFTQGTTTFDLNGCTLSGASSSGVITVNNGTMTIADSSVDGNGKVTSSVGDNNTGTINLNGGSLVVNGGTVENLYNGGPNVHTIFVSSGNVTVNGGTVKRTSDITSSYTIYNPGGTVIVTDGELSNDYIVIYNEGTLRMTGGTVTSTGTSTSSRAIYNDRSGSVSISGGEVSGFHGIYNYGSGEVSVTGGKVTATGQNAISSGDGGSISVTGGEIYGRECAINCPIYSTTNVSVTGGILSSDIYFTILHFSTGSLSVTGGRVENNQSKAAIKHYGKGRFTFGGTAVATSAVDATNSGTVSVDNGNMVEITGGTVENTNKGTAGFAIFVTNDNGRVSIKSSSPVIIKAPGKAMTYAPNLPDTVVKTAATDINGTDGVETYNPDNIATYKYLEFVPAVAKIGSTNYPTLQAAIDAVTQGDAIALVRSVQENISIMDSTSFTMNLNGKTLDGGIDHPAIRHNGSGTLTISDKSNDGDGKITGGYYATIILGGGKLNVDSGTVENFYDSDVTVITTILNEGTGKMTISGTATVTGQSTTIYLEAGIADTAILEITGGTIESTNGVAINNDGPGKIVIPSGSSTIRGAYQAMNMAPDLSSYGDVKITASTNYDGSSPEHTYFEYDYNIKTYKYLKFEPAPDIARIGSKVFTKLQEAVDAITDNGQTIDLLGNIKLTFPIVIANDNDKSFTIDLNGYTINSNVRSAIRHSGSGTLTITDDSTEGGGVVTSIHDTTYSGYTVYLDGGSLVVAGGLVENANDLTQGAAIYNNSTGSVSVVSSGMVKSKSGSAIFNVSTGKITISGSAKVTGASRAVSDIGTIYLYTYANTEDVLLEIAGGTIENTDYGYAIYNRADGKIAITSGSPVILGGYMAMNTAPDLSLYANVKVKACKDESGTKRAIYNANDIFYYRYLAFEPGTTVAKNTTTGTEYFTVQAAVDAAADEDTIELLDDIAFVNPLKISLKNNMSLTLDLKGKTFEGSIVYNCESGKLTIDDTIGGGKITSAQSSFSSGTIIASVSSEKTSVLEIKGGTVENSDASGYFGNGGNAILSKRCTVNVTGGTVTSASGGAAILNANAYPFGIVNVSGGTVKSTNINGTGAIYNEATGTVNVSGGTVDGKSRYAIYNNSTGKITISGTAMVYGSQAGVYLREGTANTTVLEITGGTVENSTTGDAVRNAGSGIVRISGGLVRATAEGGTAIRNSIGKISILGGTVEHTAAGKAIYNTGWSSIEVAGGTVHAENGEAICNEAYGTEILISGGTVSATDGTAIYNTSGFVRIVGGTAIIRGGTMAMNMEPEELDPSLKIMASTSDANGADASEISRDDIISRTIEEYYENRVQAYKYLRFEPVYSVTYQPGTNGTGSQATDSKTHDVALTLRGAVFTRTGYTQTGWATTDGGAKAYELGGSYTANTVITLYPVWTPNTYAVTYQPGTNGTGSPTADSKIHDVALALSGAVFTRDGYTQTDWATTDGGAKAFDLGSSYTANAAITLYPVWTPNTYAMIYNPGTNGTGSQATDTKTHNVALTLSGAAFTRAGYTQTGWAATDGGAKAFDLGGIYTVNAAITLYPVWTQDYAVTYYPGKNGTGSQTTDSKPHDVALTLSGAAFTRTGYTQTGWATTDGGTKAYELGGSYTNNEVITLYPVWTPDTYAVTYHPGTNGTGSQTADSKTHDVALVLRGAAFTRTGYTQTGWAITDGGTKAYELGGSYTANEGITLYPVWTLNTYAVTLPAGTGYTITAQGGSSSPMTHGGSYSFTVAITDGYQKGNDFAVKANGVSLAANGSGVYTISNVTQAQTVTVEGVEQDAAAPTPSPTADAVYNDPNKSDATIWLTGSEFAGDDLLITQALTSGSDYNALLKLADGDVFGVYEISLQSGTKSTDSVMYLTFDLEEKYAGQAFTLVHKKADGTFEYFYATAGADGNVKFGPLYELSPFMLVKGTLLDELDDIPKTGDDSSPWIWWLLGGIGVTGVALLIVMDKRKGRTKKYKA